MGGLAPAPARPVTGEALRAMAGRVIQEAGAICTGGDPVGLFASGRARIERGDAVWVAAEADLLNLDELRAVAGLDEAQAQAGLLSRLYEMEGPAFLRRLRGAFAIALWDRRQRALLLAVDPFGMRRLYYAADARGTAFASRLTALRARPRPGGAHRAGRHLQLPELRLHPGARDALHRYPAPAPGARVPRPSGLQQARALLGHELRRGASPRGPGGGHHVPPEPRGGPRGSDAVGPERDRRVPERRDRQQHGGRPDDPHHRRAGPLLLDRLSRGSLRRAAVREAGRADLRRQPSHAIIKPDDALDALRGLVEADDEPFGNNSAIGVYFCARMAREHGVSRLLAGDGGDEIFGGNERYRTDRIFARYSSLPAALRHGLLEPVLLGLPAGVPGILGRAQRYIRRANIPNPRRFYSYEFHVAQNAAEMLEPSFLRQAASTGRGSARGTSPASSQLRAQPLMYLAINPGIGTTTSSGQRTSICARRGSVPLPRRPSVSSPAPPSTSSGGLDKRTSSSARFAGSAEGDPVQAKPASACPRPTGSGPPRDPLDGPRRPLENRPRSGVLPARGARAPVRAARGGQHAVLRRHSLDAPDARALASPPRGRPGPGRMSALTSSLVRWTATGLHAARLSGPLSRALGYASAAPTFPILSYHGSTTSAIPSSPRFHRDLRMADGVRGPRLRSLTVEELAERMRRRAGGRATRSPLPSTRHRQPDPRRPDPGAPSGSPPPSSWSRGRPPAESGCGSIAWPRRSAGRHSRLAGPWARVLPLETQSSAWPRSGGRSAASSVSSTRSGAGASSRSC